MKISGAYLQIIPDSRGDDTLELELHSDNVAISASVPSGKSKGSNECVTVEPRKALERFPWVKKQIENREFSTLNEFDQLLQTLDGTNNKQNLGGNLLLVLSIGFAKLLAKAAGKQTYEIIARLAGNRNSNLPYCLFNVIEGGVHAPHSLPFQEYLYIPQTFSPQESLAKAMALIKALGEKEYEEFGRLEYGDEGGFVVPSDEPEAGLKVLQSAQQEIGDKSPLGLDVAASTFFRNGVYRIGQQSFDRQKLLGLYLKMVHDFNLMAIEDPFDQEDRNGFEVITQLLGGKVWIIGDDFITTDIKRIKMAQENQAVNAVIIKPNQIGTISETIQAATLAQSYGWKVIVSHRSGETRDTFIADLAVGLGADGFKSGCPLQEERLVKYQRLIEIEKALATIP